jgi:hypothetical protein
MYNQSFMSINVDPINENGSNENNIDTKYEISVNMIKTIYTKQEVIIFFRELKTLERYILPIIGIENQSFDSQ